MTKKTELCIFIDHERVFSLHLPMATNEKMQERPAFKKQCWMPMNVAFHYIYLWIVIKFKTKAIEDDS